MAQKKELVEEFENPYDNRAANAYRIFGGGLPSGYEIVLDDGRWRTFTNYRDAYDSVMAYINNGVSSGYYQDSGSGWKPKQSWLKQNPGMGKVLLIGGIVAAVGAWWWSRKKSVAAAPAAALPSQTPPAASPTDLAPPDDGGVIDVQGLGYYSTNRRQRIRRIPNR